MAFKASFAFAALYFLLNVEALAVNSAIAPAAAPISSEACEVVYVTASSDELAAASTSLASSASHRTRAHFHKHLSHAHASAFPYPSAFNASLVPYPASSGVSIGFSSSAAPVETLSSAPIVVSSSSSAAALSSVVASSAAPTVASSSSSVATVSSISESSAAPTVASSASSAAATSSVADSSDAATTPAATGTGTNNGFYYSFYNEGGGGSVEMGLGAAGLYTTQWSDDTDFVAGKGWATGSDRFVSDTLLGIIALTMIPGLSPTPAPLSLTATRTSPYMDGRRTLWSSTTSPTRTEPTTQAAA